MNNESNELAQGFSEQEKHELAVQLADCGGYENALDVLRDENLLSEEIKRVQEYYGVVLEDASWMTGDDWEMLAVMDCFDAKTAEHCVNTYLVAREMISSISISGWKLEDLINEEEVTLEQFYRTCLIHDIGKLSIPRSVLNNSLHTGEWDEKLCYEIFEQKNNRILDAISQVAGEPFHIEEGRDALVHFLSEHHERAMHFVPIRDVLTQEEIDAVVERFPGIDPNIHTLNDVIEFHEQSSGDVLKKKGMAVEGELVSKHHNYRREKLLYPVASETLGVSVKWEELVKLADMTEALSATRAYKKSLSIPMVCKILIDEANQGELGQAITSLWVKLQIEKDVSNSANYLEKDKEALLQVEQFIRQNEDEVVAVGRYLSMLYTKQMKMAA
jgi:HD-GYP domain-containing protein (c-di-GMP phosphodiesterase class II)